MIPTCYDSYEIGHSGEFKDPETGEDRVREFEFVKDLLDQKLFIIKTMTEADDVRLYLTADQRSVDIYNRQAKTRGLDPIELKPNFRNAVATVKPYKGTRHNEKPVHYDNLTAYMMDNFDYSLSNGIEADDQMAIDQTADPENTIICSRDKDLRQVAGNHYSWECGGQAEIGPISFDRKGWVEERVKETSQRKKDGSPVLKKSAFGGGEMFFIYQLMTGDPVDNIGGCPKVGHAKAMQVLSEVEGRKALYFAVLDLYRGVYGEDALTHLTEQARLLWLLRSADDMWEFPYVST